MASPRLTSDFIVTSIRSELGVARLLRAAGFVRVRRQLVMRRFWTFVSFLQETGLTTRVVVPSPRHVHEFSELCHSDLTDEGFAFMRACHARWLNRMGRDMGDVRERVLLSGWLCQFRTWAEGRVERGR